MSRRRRREKEKEEKRKVEGKVDSDQPHCLFTIMMIVMIITISLMNCSQHLLLSLESEKRNGNHRSEKR
jgi:hypothetical protein